MSNDSPNMADPSSAYEIMFFKYRLNIQPQGDPVNVLTIHNTVLCTRARVNIFYYGIAIALDGCNKIIYG